MQFVADNIYHVYNRGNNSQRIFFYQTNYIYFIRKIRESLLPECDILAYCLMPNHYHLLIKPNAQGCQQRSSGGQTAASRPNTPPLQSLSHKIGNLQSSYTRAVQKQEGLKGSLFQQKTKAKLLSPNAWPGINSTAICLHYIHQNPLKAGLVNRLEDWEYSSFPDYAQLRNGTLCNQKLGFDLTDLRGENFINDSYTVMREDILEKVLY
ncbi:hypothetical protein BH09BAC1_BH09BAC1_23240 [soil metagenome]